MREHKPEWLLLAAVIFFAVVSIWSCAGCACNAAKGKVDGATCARQVFVSVDALNGAATRISRRIVASCADEARALKAAGKIADSDVKYGQCIVKGQTASRIVTGLEDALQVSSDGVDIGEKMDQKDYSGIVIPVLNAARDMIRMLGDAGIKLPLQLTAFLGVL